MQYLPPAAIITNITIFYKRPSALLLLHTLYPWDKSTIKSATKTPPCQGLFINSPRHLSGGRCRAFRLQVQVVILIILNLTSHFIHTSPQPPRGLSMDLSAYWGCGCMCVCSRGMCSVYMQWHQPVTCGFRKGQVHCISKAHDPPLRVSKVGAPCAAPHPPCAPPLSSKR